ncbi:putative Ubiquitin-like domain-containing protein [Helianthus annuus]|nr:putative Ubiquitin-like domain-containing protein [Helianthus annuus]
MEWLLRTILLPTCASRTPTSRLHLSTSMNISIKNLEGRMTCSLEVKPTNTTAFVKELIGIREGISVDDQVLIFNGMVLGDSGTLYDFHINSKSTLTLIHKSRGFMNIFIKTLNGETIIQEVKPSYTIDNLNKITIFWWLRQLQKLCILLNLDDKQMPF